MEFLARTVHSSFLPLEHARLLNAVARMFETYGSGCLTLQKLQTGGKQHVVVQYQQQVNVAPGGQAMVARKGWTEITEREASPKCQVNPMRSGGAG